MAGPSATRAALLVLLAPALLAGVPPDSGVLPQYRTRSVDHPATLTGTVIWADPRPQLPDVVSTADPTQCGHPRRPNPTVLIGANGGLENAVLLIDSVVEGKAPAPGPRPVLDQIGCMFEPHVLMAHQGEEIVLANSDPVMHNVHAYTVDGMRTVFNIGLPQRGSTVIQKISRTGAMALRCDAGHPWMRGYIFVAANPYHARTDARGQFRIEGIPAGNHELLIWHEYLGQQRLDIKLVAEGTLDLAIQARKSARSPFSVGR